MEQKLESVEFKWKTGTYVSLEILGFDGQIVYKTRAAPKVVIPKITNCAYKDCIFVYSEDESFTMEFKMENEIVYQKTTPPIKSEWISIKPYVETRYQGREPEMCCFCCWAFIPAGGGCGNIKFRVGVFTEGVRKSVATREQTQLINDNEIKPLILPSGHNVNLTIITEFGEKQFQGPLMTVNQIPEYSKCNPYCFKAFQGGYVHSILYYYEGAFNLKFIQQDGILYLVREFNLQKVDIGELIKITIPNSYCGIYAMGCIPYCCCMISEIKFKVDLFEPQKTE